MRLSAIAIIAATFVFAGGVSLVAAGFSVSLVEETSEQGVAEALAENDLTWTSVEADGLHVVLTGTAPSEAERFKAITTAGSIVDAARVLDQMDVLDSAGIAPPHFSVEILRNDSGISLIGLVPASTDRMAVIKRLTALAGEMPVTDLMEAADYPVPEGWDRALDYALKSLKMLPRSKISVDASRVAITAISDSPTAKHKLETDLTRSAPGSIRLSLAISAPRPVITPYTLRFLIDQAGARFDACSADTEIARNQILKAAIAAGVDGKTDCTIGLGVPSPKWAAAVELAIKALHEIGGGTVTFSDADIALIAVEGTEQSIFDKVVGELENDLPPAFALHSVLPVVQAATAQGPAEFSATLSPEGLVQLRGRLRDEVLRETVNSYAQARFGSQSVHSAARLDDSLPLSWPLRVLTGLDALSRLSNGAVVVSADFIRITGDTGNPEAGADIARILSEKLGETAEYEIDVHYQKALDPILGLPTPDECEATIAEIQTSRKINFEPGSDKVDGNASAILDDIAEILQKCGEIQLEIGAHSDSQGREVMNQRLSQDRAQSVLNELRNRRVLTGTFTAKGYGEEQPIADNKTEAGREANRRIEFKLIRPEPVVERKTALDQLEQSGSEGASGETDAAVEADAKPTDEPQGTASE